MAEEKARDPTKPEVKPINIPLSKIHDLPGSVFAPPSQKSLEALTSSIVLKGVQEPVILRQREDGEFQIVSGNRRRKASELAKKTEIPAFIYDMTEKEAKDFLKQAEAEIDATFYMEGENADHVTLDVQPQKSYQNGMVQAEWYFDNYEVINEDGVLNEEQLNEDAVDKKEGVLLCAAVMLSCEEYEEEYQFYFRVYPRPLGEKEALLRQIALEIRGEQENRGKTYLELPQECRGVTLTWKRPKQYIGIKIVIFVILGGGLLMVHKREKKKEEEKQRKELLELDYPEIVGKLTVLLGAGMSVKQAWNKISAQYCDKMQKKQQNLHPGYEEMVKTNREICDGLSERAAYQKFAERTGIPMYRRFVRLLLQNLSKGSAGLYTLLEQETENAYIQRRNFAKKRGEEAGTKMLFPMVLMLAIVMAIVLVPAVVSFQI